jgi:hypothetical protein
MTGERGERKRSSNDNNDSIETPHLRHPIYPLASRVKGRDEPRCPALFVLMISKKPLLPTLQVSSPLLYIHGTPPGETLCPV